MKVALSKTYRSSDLVRFHLQVMHLRYLILLTPEGVELAS